MFTGNAPRPLEGVKVVELATFIAVPAAGRFLADMGADVIKIETLSGDFVRWSGANEGRPEDPLENTTFDLENGNKRSLSINLKAPEGREILFKLLDQADIFLTNWRPGALQRQGLDYQTLKERYPKLVYGSLTGYGEEGPDKDLPGYDSTAFFARGGLLGSLYDKGGAPMNLIPGLGDHQAAYMLAAGVTAAYVRALRFGQGDYVTTNLLHASVFTQGIMIQAAQYTDVGNKYPISHLDAPNPLTGAYETSDGRIMYIMIPEHNQIYPRFITALGRPDLADHPVYGNLIEMIKVGRSRELLDIITEQFKTKTLEEWTKIMIEADIPAGRAQLWEEVLEDEQAWANRVFYNCMHENGKSTVLVRAPVNFEETPAPGEGPSSTLGKESVEIVKELGYTDEQAQKLLDDKIIRVWKVGDNPFKY